MSSVIQIGDRLVGDGQPCYIIAEIGVNHNGDLATTKKLIDAAGLAGCDAVKFQKRTPQLCVPAEQRNLMRETPWGLMTYMQYRERVEFGQNEYEVIDQYCRDKGMTWFASCWDVPSLEFIAKFDPPCFKIASALLTNDNLLRNHRRYGKPIILSTGMSTMDQVDHAVALLNTDDLFLMHTNSSYPCKNEELNLLAIKTLKDRYKTPVGYSGHEVGLATSIAAVVLGACMVERHITLDRAMWGSDQAASVEPYGFARLVRDIHNVERAFGDGVKRVYDSEIPVMKRLRPDPS
jgi:N-acetylneuraminate synthase